MNPKFQRDLGYCKLYDDSAATMDMIIGCEPIYFTYGGKDWLIELLSLHVFHSDIIFLY